MTPQEVIEKKTARVLFKKLPLGLMDLEDVEQEVRLWALEATMSYEQDRGATFTTYLWKHLRNRSMAFTNAVWRKKRYPVSGLTNWVCESQLPKSQPSGKLEAAEIFAQLCSSSQQLVHQILYCCDSDVITTFTKRDYQHRVSKVLSVSKNRVRQLVEEIKCTC